jgi:hypothetical protein
MITSVKQLRRTAAQSWRPLRDRRQPKARSPPRYAQRASRAELPSLLHDLVMLCKHRVCWTSNPEFEFERVTLPTDLQRRVFEFLGIHLLLKAKTETCCFEENARIPSDFVGIFVC